MAFTLAKLTDSLSITVEQAQTVLDLIHRRISPFTVKATDDWRRSCYHEPRPEAPETIMHAINAVIETCGTEAIWGNASVTQPAAEYCNTGDTYATTILYDYIAGKYRLTSWGDFVERFEKRYGLA